MSKENTSNTNPNDPIPPDPQLTSNLPREIKPEPFMLNQNILDPIGLDPRLSNEFQKAYHPEIIAPDSQLISKIIEGHYPSTVLPQVTMESKSASQPDNTQQQSTEKE